MPTLRALYVDLDGTLLGPGGSMLRGADGAFSLEGVRALQACDRAGCEVVIYSGRRYESVFEDARFIGQRSFIFELGCGLVVDDHLEWLTGGIEPSEDRGTIFDQISATGAPALLLERYAGRLEYHTPWSAGREVSHLFRGQVDLDEVEALLQARGLGWMRLVDNGVIAGHGPMAEVVETTLDGSLVSRVHAYHLIPAASSKGHAVARHMQNRGYAAEECIAVGDSREDLEAAGVVGTFWLVANAIERDPSLGPLVAGRAGVRVATAGYGAGVYEAVVTTLASG